VRTSSVVTSTLLLSLCLTGCPEGEPPDTVYVADDDDVTVPDDDDDSTKPPNDDDDDDSAIADDDDATPASWPLTITADLPTGAVLALQSGDGPFSPVSLNGMSADVVIDDPEGRYGLLLACTGTARAGVQLHLSHAAQEPNPVIGCAESSERDGGLPALAGDVLNTADQLWSLYVGSAGWSALAGSATSYWAAVPPDSYDMIAVRRAPDGLAERLLIQRLADSANNPAITIDFDDGTEVPHTPELATLDIATTATTTSTTGVFLSRGGTVWPLGIRPGSNATFEVISDERRFWSDVFLFQTTSAYDSDCNGEALTVMVSDRMQDFNTAIARHGAPLVPLSPRPVSTCDEFTGGGVSATATTLDMDWSNSLSPASSIDTLSLELDSGDGAARWSITTTSERLIHSIDLEAVDAALGGAYPAPTAGWNWSVTGWDIPVDGVSPSELAVTVNTGMFRATPKGRSRFQFAPLPFPGPGTREERSHEYDEDDAVRDFINLPWDPIEYTVHGVKRRGSL